MSKEKWNKFTKNVGIVVDAVVVVIVILCKGKKRE